MHQYAMTFEPVRARSRATVEPGERYAMLTVLRRIEGKGKVHWLCRCDCGAEKAYPTHAIFSGHVKSCGCRLAWTRTGAASKTHGHGTRAKTPTYQSWQHMRRRCRSEADDNYRLYGARGISICERWNSFENFLADMGERPSGMTLDRIDTNGDYCPENCRWASTQQQAQNTRRAKLNEAKAAEIRALKSSGLSGREVGAKYGVCYHRVYAIWKGIAWTHVSERA